MELHHKTPVHLSGELYNLDILIYYPKREMTAAQIVDEALAYKAIILGAGDGKE